MALNELESSTKTTDAFLDFFEFVHNEKHQEIECTETHVVFVGDVGCGKTSLIHQTLGTSQSQKGRLHHQSRTNIYR